MHRGVSEGENIVTDDELIDAMFSRNSAIGRVAVSLYKARHATDQPPKEPTHCAECFEGCPKCRPEWFPKGKTA